MDRTSDLPSITFTQLNSLKKKINSKDLSHFSVSCSENHKIHFKRHLKNGRAGHYHWKCLWSLVCCCSPLSLAVLLFFLHVSPIRCLFVNTISHSKVLLFACFSKTDASFSNDVGKVEHPSLNGDRWRKKKKVMYTSPENPMLLEDHPASFLETKKVYFQRQTRNLSCKEATCWVHPPHTGCKKKPTG